MAAPLVRGLREQIAHQLRDDILAGRLGDDERLNERELAERFGVSRIPVREALVQLTHEGLLVSRSNCGVRVATPAPDAIREFLIPIRRTIETFALRLIWETLNEDDFSQWRLILERMKAACEQRDFPAIAEQDIAFHRSIVRRAAQPDLLAVWSGVVARIRSHFRQSHSRHHEQNPLKIHASHRMLVNAFRIGPLELAIKALEEHIRTP
jgi:DNA-binding GntR family transcriptional regulator